MKFYKIRALILLSVTKLFSAILFVEKTPLVSVANIIEKDGKLLFLQLSYLNGLGLPGGIIQSMENIENAIQREIKEETGLNVIELDYFYSTTAFFRGYPTLSIIFRVKTEGETKESKEGRLIWLKPEEALGKLAYEANEKALRKYLESRNLGH